MTPNRRIALNVIATYGRSLFAMACGLFSSRWALMALGQQDYGLYGVIGGLIFFVTFFHELMASAISRFYAFSVGAARKCGNAAEGLEDCRRWFNTALMVHSILPILLLLAGYPSGIWAIHSFLQIPSDRVQDCVWVWRFTCLSCFVSMCSVPFRALYTAKQEIAELTVYGIFSTACNVCVLYYMVSHPGVWLARYAFFMSLISVVPNGIIVSRAIAVYPECKFVLNYWGDWARLRQLLAFAGSRSVYLIAQISSIQGMAILVNKGLGAVRNATLTIGNSVNAHTMQLASAFSGAFQPAIANAVGEGKGERVRNLAFHACVFSLLSFMIFMVPLSLEIREVLRLWLATPPERVELLCIMFFAVGIIDRATDGHWMTILAYGRIARYQLAEAVACFSAVIVAGFLVFWCDADIEAVGYGMIACRLISTSVRLYYGRLLCGLSVRRWMMKLMLPICTAACASLLAGSLVVWFFDSSFVRIIMTTIVVEVVLLPLVWKLVLDEELRARVRQRVLDVRGWMGR